MDGWGIAIAVLSGGLAWYYGNKNVNPKMEKFWLVICGVGIGILVGALWAMVIVNQAIAIQSIRP